jgi:hypothetical protein
LCCAMIVGGDAAMTARLARIEQLGEHEIS